MKLSLLVLVVIALIVWDQVMKQIDKGPFTLSSLR